MIFNGVAVLLAVVIAAAASQLPEFAQQYRQRLGGAIDELQYVVRQFDADAAERGMTRAQGIDELKASPDPFVRGRGIQMSEIESRLNRLRQQMRDFETRAPLGTITALVENFDTDVAQGAYADFKPAMPLTFDGIVSSLVGFAGGLSLLHLCAWPVRRRYRRRIQRNSRNGVRPA